MQGGFTVPKKLDARFASQYPEARGDAAAGWVKTVRRLLVDYVDYIANTI